MITLNRRIFILLLISFNFCFCYEADFSSVSSSLCGAAELSDFIVWGKIEKISEREINHTPDTVLLKNCPFFSDSIKRDYIELIKRTKSFDVTATIHIYKAYDKIQQKWHDITLDESVRDVHFFVEDGYEWDMQSIFLTRKTKNYPDTRNRVFFFSQWENGLLVGSNYSHPYEKEQLKPISCKAALEIKHNQIRSVNTTMLEYKGW